MGQIPLTYLFAFLLVVARTGAFIAIAPPFASSSIPSRVKAGLAVALALPVTAQMAARDVPTDTGALIAGMLLQIGCGLAMGFVIVVLNAAIQAAGELVDTFGMFTMASMLDPVTNTNSSMFGRVHGLMATTLLFVSGGHLIIVGGLVASFRVDPAVSLRTGLIAEVLIADVGRLVVSAIEIAGPVAVVLFCTDVALGLVARAVPSLNVFSLSFPVKTLVTISVVGVTFSLLPAAVEAVVSRGVDQMGLVVRLLGG